jgi:hypothetical protein
MLHLVAMWNTLSMNYATTVRVHHLGPGLLGLDHDDQERSMHHMARLQPFPVPSRVESMRRGLCNHITGYLHVRWSVLCLFASRSSLAVDAVLDTPLPSARSACHIARGMTPAKFVAVPTRNVRTGPGFDWCAGFVPPGFR